jgi:hypothetical protein
MPSFDHPGDTVTALCCLAADVHLQPNHHKELMDEVKAAAGHVAMVRELNTVADAAGAGDGAEDAPVNPLVGQLHHVETADKSKPVLDPSTHVQKVRCPGLEAAESNVGVGPCRSMRQHRVEGTQLSVDCEQCWQGKEYLQRCGCKGC